MSSAMSPSSTLQQGWSVRYPSPFLDIASTYLPQTPKEMMRWYKFYSVTDDIASSTIRRLASFPVTKIIFEEANKDVRKIYEELFHDQLGIKPFAVKIGLDYHAFGIAAVSVMYPFTRYLVCTNQVEASNGEGKIPCGKYQEVRRATWKWKKKWFYGKCPKCKQDDVKFGIVDRYKPDRTRIKLKCWDPENLEILSSEECVEEVYYLRPSEQAKEAVARGDRYILENIPKVFLDAINMGENGAVRLDRRWVHFFRRPARSDSRQSGFGCSVLFGVLKKLFYKQVLLKAQEQLAQQHIVPLWVIFPSATADMNPFTDINLGTWRTTVERQLARWRRDPNFIPILPIPLGFQQIGGSQAEAGIHQQLEAVNKDIVAGMGVPMELVFGGLSYSAASVTVRLVENDFASYQHDLNRVIQEFVVGNICRFLGLKPVRTRLQTLKMVDDVQQKTALNQLLQLGHISRRRVLEAYDIDPDEDKEWRAEELKATAKEMIEQAVASARAQAAGAEELQKAQIRMQLRMQILQQEVQEDLAEQAGMDPAAIQVAHKAVQESGGYRDVDVGGNPLPTPDERATEAAAAMGGIGGMAGDPEKLVKAHAQTISGMPGDLRARTLESMDPELSAAIQKELSSNKGSSGKSKPKDGKTDMRPQPKQKPPRRATKSI